MKILKRLSLIFRSSTNALLDTIENPAIITEEMLNDYDKQIQTVKRGLSEFEFEIISLEQKLTTNNEKISELNALADQAIKDDKENLACEYEQELLGLENENILINKQLSNNKPKLQTMRQTYTGLLDKRREAAMTVKEIQMNTNMSKALSVANGAMGSSIGSIQSDLDKINQKTQKNLYVEENAELDQTSSERKAFESEVNSGKLNDRIAARKAKILQ